MSEIVILDLNMSIAVCLLLRNITKVKRNNKNMKEKSLATTFYFVFSFKYDTFRPHISCTKECREAK